MLTEYLCTVDRRDGSVGHVCRDPEEGTIYLVLPPGFFRCGFQWKGATETRIRGRCVGCDHVTKLYLYAVTYHPGAPGGETEGLALYCDGCAAAANSPASDWVASAVRV